MSIAERSESSKKAQTRFLIYARSGADRTWNFEWNDETRQRFEFDEVELEKLEAGEVIPRGDKTFSLASS